MKVIKDVFRKILLVNLPIIWQNWLNQEGLQLRIDLQQHQLKVQKVNSDDEIIGFYSANTEFLSGGLKKEGDPFDLFSSGNFQESFDTLPFPDEIQLFADDDSIYDKPLTEKYGIEIIQLTDENKKIYKENFKEFILANITRF